MDKNDFNSFFHPQSVAIIGASENKEKVGGKIFQNALASKNLKVIPVNLQHKSISGQKCYKNLGNVKEKIDIAIIVIPREFVPDALKDVVREKIKFCIIISSGFKEKDETGKKLEAELAEIIKKGQTRLLGPNCLGILTPKLNLTFGPKIEHSGEIPVLSQSGAIGSSLIDFLNRERIGLSSFVSLGNKTDISEIDFLDYFKREEDTPAIFLYLESFKNGHAFFELSRNIAAKIPIIVLKPGVSKSARRAMTSHTGALISDEIAVKTAFSDANLINAENLEDFFGLLKYFSFFHIDGQRNSGEKVAIVTNAGGVGVLLADLLPESSPLDIGGAAKAEDYEKAFFELNNLRALFCVITPQEVTEIEKTAELIVEKQKLVKYPIFVILPGGNKVLKAEQILKENECLVFDFPEDAVRIYRKVTSYEKKVSSYKPQKKTVRKKSFFFNIFPKFNNHGKLQSVQETQKLAQEYNLPINEEYPVKNFGQLKTIAKKINYPVVLKIHGEKFLHKTELNALKLHIESDEELHTEYNNLSSLASKGQNEIAVSKELARSLEVIIGVKKDPDFGYLLMFGMGGIYTEIMKDLSYGLLPMTRTQILEMIRRTHVYQIIEGARNLPKLDMNGIIDCIENLGTLVSENPWISELDINPLFVAEKEVKIVDLKIK